MKKLSFKTNVFAVLLLLTVISIAVPASAMEDNNPAIEFKYLGQSNGLLVFQLALKDAVPDEYAISIMNKDGNVIYADKVKGDKVVKKLLFKSAELGDNDVLRIKIKSKKTSIAETYEINRDIKVIEETVVYAL